MSYMSEKINRVLEALQQEKTRCTYGALADYIGASPRDIGKLLTPKRPESSWVVNKKTGLPTGYETFQLHPDLKTHEKVLDQGDELRRLLA